MAAITQPSHKLKIGYRRAESDPAATTVNDIRCKFESSGIQIKSPELGLAYGVKQRSSTPSSTVTSPLVPKKNVSELSAPSHVKTPVAHKTPIKQNSDSKLNTRLDKPGLNGSSKHNPSLSTAVQTGTSRSEAVDNGNAVKPNSLPLSNHSKQAQDKHSLISQYNVGIVSTRKQNLFSPNSSSSPTVQVTSVKASKLSDKLESLANKFQASQPASSCNTQSINKAEQKTQNPPIQRANKDYNHNRNTSISSVSSLSSSECGKSPLTPAKSFWKAVSMDSDRPESKHNSLVEPGLDYTKIKKPLPPTPTQATKLRKASGGTDVDIKDNKQVHTTATATNLRRVSDSLGESKMSSQSFDTDQPSRPISKSPSVSSTCSSMESDAEYYNGGGSKLRRRETKPPTNIVARRTQLFEKSLDEINSVLEEAEAYNKLKAGFGTVFTSKETPESKKTNKPKIIKSVPHISPQQQRKPRPQSAILTNNNTKLLNPNQTSGAIKPILKREKVAGDTGAHKPLKHKPLPPPPVGVKHEPIGRESEEFVPKPGPPIALKPNSLYRGLGGITLPPQPPPKPPRTFEHPELGADTDFDPAAIPRQAGDGEENHDYEKHVSCQSNHVYTSVTVSNERPYTSTVTTTVDTRTYMSLTTTGSSGGDDSIAGSENAYDTLGKASVASSYEHYDTISQSELDSDVSRPPTLPRRPSNLRHRPLTTAFGHLDINKNNANFHSQLNKALSNNAAAATIKEASPTSPSPTKSRVPFKLKYLLPKARRKAEPEMRKASSVSDLLDDSSESLYDSVDIRPESSLTDNTWSNQTLSNNPQVPIDEAGYAMPDIKSAKRQSGADLSTRTIPGEQTQPVKSQADKNTEKIRLKLNQAFSALRRPVAIAPQASDGEDEERLPDPEVLEEMLKHCTSVKEHAIYASVEQIRGFMTRVYAQLYDYAVIVALRKNPDTNVYEPYVKYKFPPQVNVEVTTVPQFCYPDAHISHKLTEYKSEAFSFVLTDVTGTRQYGYCRRVLPPDLNNLPRTPEVMCVVSPLNATKLYNQVLDEVERRRMQSPVRAEEFLQAVYGRPLPSPGQTITIRAMNVYEEPESLMFTRSPDSQREGIDYECLLSLLSISQIIKIFASILLERKIIFIAEKLSTLSSCVHAFASIIYPFSWQHTFIPLLPPNLIDVVCAPTPYIVGLLSSNSHLLNSLEDEMEEVLIVDLDNHRFIQRMGDEKSILPKKLHRALTSALDMAKSESQSLRNVMVAEAFLRFFLETTGSFNHFMIHVPGAGRQFQKEEFVCNASNAPSIMVFLQWFTATQMFEVYATERENDRNVISGTFEERVFEFQSEDHEELFSDSRRFKKFKLFGKNKKK